MRIFSTACQALEHPQLVLISRTVLTVGMGGSLKKRTHRIWLTVDLIILRVSCLVDHDTAKLLVLALQRLDDFVGFTWLEIHFRVIRCIWRRRKTKVDLSLRIV